MLRPGTILAACALLASTGGCSFEHLRYKTPELTLKGEQVRVLEIGETPPPGCTYVRNTKTQNMQGPPEDMRIKLRNQTGRYGGNLLLLTSFGRLAAEGRVYRCPEEVLASTSGGEESDSAGVAPASTPGGGGTSDMPPPPPPAQPADAGPAQESAEPAPSSEALDAEARGIFLAGKAAYGDSRYEDALEHFRRAYELSKRPTLLFNVGQAADKLRRDREALSAFEKYLEQVPDGEGRREAESRVRVLRDVLKSR